ncbi:MAG TPA: maleylacetate reductase [Actinomycetes bacterium]|nr:maleylacetate reductase [Actinomycetes bacterium]
MPDPAGLRRLDFPGPFDYRSGAMPPFPAFVHDALPGRVVFGVGSVEHLGEEVDRLGAGRVLAIAGKRAIDGLVERLGGRWAASFTDVQQHVPVEAAARAVAAASEAGADCLVAMGGGSATGMAKAVALERQVPIVAVPTTYAGSEVTPIYGLTGPEGKRTGRDPRVLPRTVVYDPALTTGLPAQVTGPSGMNALAHCVEALYAPGANPVTSLLAEEGARALHRGLPGAVADPGDLAARSDALLGAWLAGTALAAAGIGIHHQLCHLLGGAYRLPHAELHAVVLPHAVHFVAPAARPQLARLARSLGVDDAAGGIWDLGRRLGTPASLAELGLAEAELDRAAEQAVARVVQTPRRAGVSELRALLEAAWQGGRPPPA